MGSICCAAANARDVPTCHNHDGTRSGATLRAAQLSNLLNPLVPAERLVRFRREVAGRLVFTTSFSRDICAVVED
jgi:hypothetical protein